MRDHRCTLAIRIVNIIDRNEYLTKTKTFLENIPRVVHSYRHDDPRSLLQPIRSEGCDQDVLASHQRKSEWGGEFVNQQYFIHT